jgi:murein tripeptide amidase MpaA
VTTVTTARASERIEVRRLEDEGPIELAIPTDTAADVRQWFAFSVESDGPEEREVVVVNAGEVTYPGAWEGYDVHVLRAGRRTWSRLSTAFEDGVVRFVHRAEGEVTRYAYFAPYSVERAERLVLQVAGAPGVHHDVIGKTLLGRPIRRVVIGDPSADFRVWVVARQHPGETPAGWAAEGLLRAASASPHLFERLCLHVVPLANPDGAAAGNMRTNAAGIDLNRSWEAPSEQASPESLHVLRAIERSGVDLFLDLHADETCTHAFPSLCEGNPGYTERLAELEAAFVAALADASPDFVIDPFYDLDAPGAANLGIAANLVGERFGCPAATLELPIKPSGDERVAPGFSPTRARRLGASIVGALECMLDG